MSNLAKQPLSYFLQEQRETNIKQNDLIAAQQHLIDLLAQLLTENGLGETLNSDGVSKLVGQAEASGLNPAQRTFGPTSLPMLWAGGLEDPIPVTYRGADTTARIVTTEEAVIWNNILDLNIQIRKCKEEIETDQSQLENYYNFLRPYIDKETTNPEYESQIRGHIKDSIGRLEDLKDDVKRCEAKVARLNRKLRHKAPKFLLRSNLRKKGDPTPWLEKMQQDLNESLHRGDSNIPHAFFDRTLKDERTADREDTDDEGPDYPC